MTAIAFTLTVGTDQAVPASPSIAVRTSREAAHFAVCEWRRNGAFVLRTLDDVARGLSPAERRFAVELACGVLRRPSALDALIEPHVARPRHRVEDELWTLLQLGTYQAAFLDSIPAHAAVHETVELARRSGHPRWTGFANAVLRKVAESLSGDAAEPSANAVPLVGGRYRRCRLDVFPNPADDPRGYVARAHSLPRWLVDRWAERFDTTELMRIGFWFHTPPAVWLRVNTLRTTREEFLSRLKSAGIEAAEGLRAASIRLEAAGSPESLPGFREGLFTVQDESAMSAAELLAPAPGWRVLDLCAAPGTKTTHLAELMRNEGRIVATDVSDERLVRIGENCDRLGVSIVETRRIGDGGSNLPDGPFDAVLVDVPCSNTGVLARRPEARWRIASADIDELAAVQRRLLRAACERVRPGGRVVYSTCSMEPEENERLVRSVLRHAADVRFVEERRHVPGRPADGGYQALLERSGG